MKYRAIGENHLFVKVYANGKKAGTPSCAVYVLKDRHARLLAKARPDKQKINRIGLTVTKKLGSAVQRSRIRRVLREAFRAIDKTCGVRTGNLIVLVAREKSVSAKTQEIEKDLFEAFSRLGLLQRPDAFPVDVMNKTAHSPSSPEGRPGNAGPGKIEITETGALPRFGEGTDGSAP